MILYYSNGHRTIDRNDLSFDMFGYVMVLLNDVATAGNGIVSKMKLETRELGKNGITFYNALFMVVPLIAVSFFTGDVDKVRAEATGFNRSMGIAGRGATVARAGFHCRKRKQSYKLTSTKQTCLGQIQESIYENPFEKYDC